MTSNVTRLDGQGRIVIPAVLRRALGLHEGDELTLELEDGALRVLTRGEAMRRAQEYVSRLTARTDGSLADELIAERRAEAANE
jgi:antitoxin PrlF